MIAYCELELRGGHTVYFDAIDYSLIRPYWWTVQPLSNGHLYASAKIGNQPVRMHTLIMNPPAGYEVDHRDRNGLDNRRTNLRICTHGQNCANTGLSKRNTSGYKGVSWSKRDKKWESYITFNQKRRGLGYFTDINDAARAYNRAALEQWGEFALLNDVPDETAKGAHP